MKLAATVVTLMLALSACPDRREAIDQVGSAPKAQVDYAQERLHKDEAKLQQRANDADAAKE